MHCAWSRNVSNMFLKVGGGISAILNSLQYNLYFRPSHTFLPNTTTLLVEVGLVIFK